ncbi:MAG: ABC transporter substrate-binding protein [Alphaproteobacteria bacterium]
MKRRDLIGSAVAAAVLAPFGTAAQPGLPVIGYFSNRSPAAETPLRSGFLQGLEQAGFVVGRNVVIEYRFAEGRSDRLPSLAAELIELPAAVLVATGGPEAVAAKKATATIPIVFTSGGDPVGLGLVASLNRPGGNATGAHVFGAEMIPKRMELLREVLPQPGLIAVLLGPTTPVTEQYAREAEAAAQAIGQPIIVLQARDDGEVETAFATMAERRVRGLLFGPSTYFQVIADKLIALAARHRIPAVYEWPEFVAAGGLMTYSTNRREFAQLAGEYAGRILNGAAPADLPVVRSTRFELVINLKTARDLGLTISESLLARADEVIE